MKKVLIATVLVFLAWVILGLLWHWVLLMPVYEEYKHLWRSDMKMWVSYLVTLIAAGVFSCIYHCYVSKKSVKRALMYGLVYGIGSGIGMGYGTYAHFPIPYILAFSWFLISIADYLVAGLITGWIIKEDAAGS